MAAEEEAIYGFRRLEIFCKFEKRSRERVKNVPKYKGFYAI